MNKFLSIGEVAKMKGVSHRALRHYDDLGILTPAYTNPDTGYRYYSKNQMLILDIVMMCVPLGIPLLHFKNYISDDGSIDAKLMIEDAKVKALEKQKEVEQKLYFLNSALAHFTEINNNAHHAQSFTKHIDRRYFMVTSAPQDFGILTDYWTHLTMLYKSALNNGFSLSIDQGLCFYMEDNITQVKYYVEIKKPHREHPNVLSIPKTEFLCEIFEDTCFFEAIDKYQQHESYLAGNMLIVSDIFEEKITQAPAPFEIQLLLK